MALIDLVKDKFQIISVVGMEKNVGKTVVLNELLEQMDAHILTPGITSIGRDGESRDVVSQTEKPLIYLTKGSLVATLDSYINRSEMAIEILELTDYQTSMGQVIIGRCLESGTIEVAGPSSNKGIKHVAHQMLCYGADLVIVDGALNRVSSASPAITQGTILATGAQLNRDMSRVIEQTYHQVHLFNLKSVENESVKKILNQAINDYPVSIVDDGFNVTGIEVKTALNASQKIIDVLKESSKYIVFSGSLTGKIIHEIHQAYGGTDVTFIVRDATKVFVSERDLNYFTKFGISIKVIDEINLLALTINPYAPAGYQFDGEAFMDKMSETFKDIKVVNVLEGGVR